MNEMIILGAMMAVMSGLVIAYGVIGVAYYKLVLGSKKSIGQILSEI